MDYEQIKKAAQGYQADMTRFLQMQNDLNLDLTKLQPLHRAQHIRFCLLRFRWKVGTMNFPRGKPLLFGESKASVAMLRTPCAF